MVLTFWTKDSDHTVSMLGLWHGACLVVGSLPRLSQLNWPSGTLLVEAPIPALLVPLPERSLYRAYQVADLPQKA